MVASRAIPINRARAQLPSAFPPSCAPPNESPPWSHLVRFPRLCDDVLATPVRAPEPGRCTAYRSRAHRPETYPGTVPALPPRSRTVRRPPLSPRRGPSIFSDPVLLMVLHSCTALPVPPCGPCRPGAQLIAHAGHQSAQAYGFRLPKRPRSAESIDTNGQYGARALVGCTRTHPGSANVQRPGAATADCAALPAPLSAGPPAIR